ncbi:MAG: AAA domain-containing protein [Pseudomarimonas sp.]
MPQEESGIPMVVSLLNYIEQVEKLKTKPAFSVPEDFFVAYQQELASLPEVQFNLQSEGDDIWLRLPRLKEIGAPEPDEEVQPWITLPKSPEKQPELKAESLIFDGKQEASRSRIEDHPEIKELFNWYVENQWNPWALAERPRRKAISRYNKFFSLQQAIASEGAETPIELVWGIGYTVWRKEGFATPVKHPLLVQACEVTLNERTFDLEVRPRDVEARIEADCYLEMDLPGVRQLEAYWQSAQATGAHRINPFESSTYEGTLKAAVGHLDPTGTYDERGEDAAFPTPGPQLRITNNWVLFARKRSGDIFLQDIKRLKEKLAQVTSLPAVIRSLVQRGDGEVRVRPEQPFRGLSTSEAGAGALELFFPMPYNDEQVSIIQKLHANDGVVVQGPPGTGKTHTIANVICHYLAEGKRVLVTAKGESALAVLQEKLPEAIRALSISLLSDERDGMKQFEHAIQTIASRVASINPTRVSAAINAAEEKLNQLHAKISHVDNTVAANAANHMESFSFRGRAVTPEELAKSVILGAQVHEWLDDEPPASADDVVPFDDVAIAALRRSRLAVGSDLPYLDKPMPAADGFPPWTALRTLHFDLMKARDIDESVSEGDIFGLVDSRLETFEKGQGLVRFLEDRRSLAIRLAGVRSPWLSAVREQLSDMQEQDPLLVALMAVVNDVRRLEVHRRELVAKAIAVPPNAEINQDFQDAVARLVAGRSAFTLPFGKGEARKQVAEVTVAGAAPSGKDDWSVAAELISWRVDSRKVLSRWNAMASEFGLPTVDTALDPGFRSLAQWHAAVDDSHRLRFVYDANLHSLLLEVFGGNIADKLWDGGEEFLTAAHSSLQSHVSRGRLAYAVNKVQELLAGLEGYGGAVVDQMRGFLVDGLGHDGDEMTLQAQWTSQLAELRRLNSLRPYFDEILAVTAKIEAAGAPKWSSRLRAEPATEVDTLTPANWMDAWSWRQAVMFLDRIDGHHQVRELFKQRQLLTTALSRTYQELIAEKTWLSVFQNSPDSVRQALQAYLNSVGAMGAGTGVRAVRHRRTAREAMARAYQAVPCWVLPQWRVSETIPPELGLFDLVIIDEASQSDIWALPAILRGKQVLVVGDHKQVSPSAVGAAEEKIKDLISRFLVDQPFGSEMTPDKSIYDLARVVFAGNSVMLKEHFRCVPAIIEFSNREFYQNDIKPLRVPKANERLDPPLVDVFVMGGHRAGGVNAAEAKAIVDEIKLILGDPAFGTRTIGVVTLLGTEQAAHIHELVSQQISPIDVIARKLAIGPPPVFQGRERDIMLVSMVMSTGGRAAASRADMNQRFNVALSRARDRMYLFRSVSEADVGEGTLNAKVLSHFKQPFRQDARRVESLRARCESGFELAMYDELVKRGFRVEPQVPCGGYRIDFVIEGSEGRRLAVECDGDRYHGPGQWQDDMTRQRVLERAGWTFWRCFASSFVRRREAVLEDLMLTLAGLGIEPLGAESVDNTVWVQHKVVDPYSVQAETPPELA